MAKRKTSRKRGKMRVGECRRTKAGTKFCKLQNGKVKFKRG